MAIETHCPGCSTKVQVPESLLGKRVKCPKCSQIFVAEDPNAAYEEIPEEEERPRPNRRPAPVDDYEEVDQHEDDDDYEPRPRRRRGSRPEAEAAVKAPAIALIVIGGLGLLYALFNLIIHVAGGGNEMAMFGQMKNQNQAAFRIGHIVGIGVTFLWGIFVPVGGVMMLNMRGYGLAMTGAIIAMLPCNLGCLLGLPFGIWALVVLNRLDVKRAFT